MSSEDVVEVIPYQTTWPQLFAEEAELIKSALGENCIAVHHIGSTAIPGLSAKPIIDMIPVVKDIFKVEQAIPAMEKLGYVSKGEAGMLFRHFFQKGDVQKTHNIHVYEEGSPEIDRHIQFRDWMRAHKEDRDAYQNLKIDLAKRFPQDITSYCFGKDAFVATIDEKTGFDGLRIVQALTNYEWASVKHLRQKYFFDAISIDDPYTLTFKDDAHVHLVLYKGAKVIGYAHIQYWPAHRAALRMMVIDEPYRNHGIGGHFLKSIERWLKHQKITTLHVESSPAAYAFYCKHDYQHMAFNDPEGKKGDPRDIEVGKTL